MENLPESHQTPKLKLYHWVIIIFVWMLVVAGFVAWIQQWTLTEFANTLIAFGFGVFLLTAMAYVSSSGRDPRMPIGQYQPAITADNIEKVGQRIMTNRQILDKMMIAVSIIASLNVGLGLLIRWLVS
jgi:hypothetical protein